MMTYDVFELAEQEGVPIRINDCSNEAKHLQETRKAANGLSELAVMAGVQAISE